MGSPFNLILVSEDSAKASKLARASFLLIDSFSHIYSDYDREYFKNKEHVIRIKYRQHN